MERRCDRNQLWLLVGEPPTWRPRHGAAVAGVPDAGSSSAGVVPCPPRAASGSSRAAAHRPVVRSPLAGPVLRNGLMGRPWGAPGERAGGSLLPGGAPGPRRGSRECVPRSARVKRGSEASGEGGSAAELPVNAWLGGPASRGGTGAAVGSEGSQSLLGAEGRSGGRPGRSCRGEVEEGESGVAPRLSS